MLAVPNYTIPSAADFTVTDFEIIINATVVPSDMNNAHAVAQIDRIRNSLFHFYVHGHNQENASNPLFPYIQFTRFVSDTLFIVGILWEVSLKAQLGWPIHLYHFDNYAAPRAYPALPYQAVPHIAEIQYVLQHTGAYYQWSAVPVDRWLTEVMVGAITGMVFNGEAPRSWPAFPSSDDCSSSSTASNVYRALKLNYTAEVETNSSEIAHRLAFWDELSNEHDLSLVRNFPNTMRKAVPSPLHGNCTQPTSFINATMSTLSSRASRSSVSQFAFKSFSTIAAVYLLLLVARIVLK